MESAPTLFRVTVPVQSVILESLGRYEIIPLFDKVLCQKQRAFEAFK